MNAPFINISAEIPEGRAELLKDGHGVYGVGIRPTRHPEPAAVSVIYRPDRLVEQSYSWTALHPVPNMSGWLWGRCAESVIADHLLTEMLAKKGLDRHQTQPNWWSSDPVAQGDNRRMFHGLKRSALAVTNALVRRALTSAPPDALKIARRFPISRRWKIYRSVARSQRMLQLADAFPLLAVAIVYEPDKDRSAEAHRLLEAGVRLNKIAGLMDVSMAWRGLKPGAMSRLSSVPELKDHVIYDTMPSSLPAQRRWLVAIRTSLLVGGPYTEWVARNYHLFDCPRFDVLAGRISDIGDWVRASYIVGVPKHVQRALGHLTYRFGSLGEDHVTRLFSPDMSVATVTDLSGAWHEAVALSDPKVQAPLPKPWREAAKIGDLDIVPLDTAAAIAAEGRAMHHCARTLLPSVRHNLSYLYSVRKGDERVATVEVMRAPNGEGVSIRQMRGIANSILPVPLQTKLRKWAGERDRWKIQPPISMPARPANALFDDEIPF
jgi:hypothetical protein